MLTRKQRQVLELIADQLARTGVAPSYEEIRQTLKLSSRSSVHRMVNCLQERGYIRRLPHRARAMEVLRMAHETIEEAAPAELDDQPRATEDLPVLGFVAAGEPIVVWSATHSYIGVPSTFVHPGSKYYALEVRGESMIDDGILDGDIAIIREQQVANNNDIVVAMVDDSDVTLKRFRMSPSKRQVTLVAANKDFAPIRLPANRVEVQGRLTGLLRRYD